MRANVWFHDDGSLVGRRSDLESALNILREEGPRRGLILSDGIEGKTVVWSPVPESPWDFSKTNIRHEKTEGIEVLGAPVGSIVYCLLFIVYFKYSDKTLEVTIHTSTEYDAIVIKLATGFIYYYY